MANVDLRQPGIGAGIARHALRALHEDRAAVAARRRVDDREHAFVLEELGPACERVRPAAAAGSALAARAAGARAAATAAAAGVGLALEIRQLLVGVAMARRREEWQHLAHRRHERELAAQLALVFRVVLVGLDVHHDGVTRHQAVGAVASRPSDSR